MKRPPISARFVPGRAAVGMLARFAFWPLAFVGARALNAGDARIVAFAVILGSLVASSVTRARSRSVAGGGIILASVVVGLASFAAARASFLQLGPTAAFVLAVASALGAALSFSRTLVVTRAFAEPSLDADALALAPAATWLFLCSLLTRFGAEATHVHVLVPALAHAVAVIASLLAAIAVVTLARQRAWTARVYRGEAPPLAVSVASDGSPPLSHVEGADAAVVIGGEALDPYRRHRPSIARVPPNPEILVGRYTTRARAAALALAGGLGALLGGAHAGAVHRLDDTSSPRRLPTFPARCAAAPPKLRFVPLAPLTLVDVEEIAARYRRAGVEARVDAPLAFDERFRDPQRGQLIAEELVRAGFASHAPRDPRELVVVLTDGDMFTRSKPWRFAFALMADRLAVVSLARMDPSFPWLSPRSYTPRRPACAVDLRARAFKMITRQLVLRVCAAPPADDGHSVRRASVLSLADLDAIEEDNY